MCECGRREQEGGSSPLPLIHTLPDYPSFPPTLQRGEDTGEGAASPETDRQKTVGRTERTNRRKGRRRADETRDRARLGTTAE